MKTSAEIIELGQSIRESAKNVSWKDVEKLKKICKNIHLLRVSYNLLQEHKTKTKLTAIRLDLIQSTDAKDVELVRCIDYILKDS